MSLYQFMLKMETTQYAVIIMAMRWYVCLPWAAKLSWTPVLTSDINEDKESEKKNADECFEGLVSTDDVNPVNQPCWLTPCLPGSWGFPKPVVWALSPLAMLETLTFSFYRYPFLWTHPSPRLFCFSLNLHLCLSMLLGDVTLFQFLLSLFKVGCSLMIFLDLP